MGPKGNPTPDRLAVAVDMARHLNGPMVARLRRCAADASPNWEHAATVYPPDARGLVALIDHLLGSASDEPDKRS